MGASLCVFCIRLSDFGGKEGGGRGERAWWVPDSQNIFEKLRLGALSGSWVDEGFQWKEFHDIPFRHCWRSQWNRRAFRVSEDEIERKDKCRLCKRSITKWLDFNSFEGGEWAVGAVWLICHSNSLRYFERGQSGIGLRNESAESSEESLVAGGHCNDQMQVSGVS